MSKETDDEEEILSQRAIIEKMEAKIAELQSTACNYEANTARLERKVEELERLMAFAEEHRGKFYDAGRAVGASEMAEIAVKQHLRGPGWSLNEIMSEEDGLMKLWKESKK